MNIKKTLVLLTLLVAELPLFSQVPRSDQSYYYPDKALENKIQGKVYVKFLALPTGHIIDSSVVVARGLGYGLDEMAIEAIKEAPPMKRNRINKLNKNETMQYVIPIIFQIQPSHWSEYHLRKAEHYLQDGQKLKSLESIELALSFNQRNADAHYLAFKLYQRFANHNEACTSLKRAKRYDATYQREWKQHCR